MRALTSGSLTETSVILTVTDGQNNQTTLNIKVSITGTNTAPDLSIDLDPNADSPVVENGADGADSLSGSFSVRDVDGTVASVTATDGSYGKVELVQDEDGLWTYKYTLDERAEVLAEGETRTDSFTVTVTDAEGAATEKTVLVHIKGANDAPVIDTATAAHNAGSLDFHDVDAADSHTLFVVVNGVAYEVTDNSVTIDGKGVFTFTRTRNADGKQAWAYTFEADPAAQAAIKEGDSEELKFQLKVSDGIDSATSKELTVTVDGVNRAPQIGRAVLALVLTELTPDADVRASSDNDNADPRDNSLPTHDIPLFDQDEGDLLAYDFADMNERGDVQGTFGILHFDADSGEYSYTLNTSRADLVHLAEAHAAGGDLTERFAYTVSDGLHAPVSGSVVVDLAPRPMPTATSAARTPPTPRRYSAERERKTCTAAAATTSYPAGPETTCCSAATETICCSAARATTIWTAAPAPIAYTAARATTSCSTARTTRSWTAATASTSWWAWIGDRWIRC